MRPGITVTAVVAAGLFVTSCGSSTEGSGTVGTGTIAPASSTAPTTASSTTTSGSSPTATTSTAPPVLPPSGTGAYGYVTAGPTCPVERQGQPCPPRAVAAGIEARAVGGTTVASTRSDASGRYAIDLSPGSYTLVVVTPSGWPRCPDTSVTARPGSATRVDISCDTGIR